jgi:(2Fe-2S) ferredoxin
MEAEIKAKGLENEVQVIRTGCFGLCALGPIMIVYPEGCFYSEVKVEDVPEIVEEHLLKGRMVKRLLYSETVTPTEIKRLTNIGKKKFKRYFSRLAGLSWYEKNQLTAEQKDTYTKSCYENLIQDNPEDMYKDIPTGELHNLSIYKGTISAQERKKVEQHAQETENILKMLKLPKELKNIVTYASEHHEQPCGKGYPKGLTEEQLSIPSRIMTIADIFEALTSSGRPYKTPKKLSEALKIMKIMKDKKQIDDKIYTMCLEKGIFIKYANKYLSPDQLDITDVSDFY